MNPVQRLIEAILRPVLALVGELMARLFLAPFAALFGPKRDEDEPEEVDDPRSPALEDSGVHAADEPPRLEDRRQP